METLYTVYRRDNDELMCFEQPGEVACELLGYANIGSFRSMMSLYKHGKKQKYVVEIRKVPKKKRR